MNAPLCDIAVVLDAQHADQCRMLSAQLGIPLVKEINNTFPFFMVFTSGCLALQQSGDKAPGPVLVDFVSGVASHRRKQGGGELIVKAIGGDKQCRPSVVDATAGLGRDSFVLASWGFPVVMCERSAVIAALLEDGMQRAKNSEDVDVQAILTNLTLEQQDAASYLLKPHGSQPPDVVYIDPMFPVSGKSALVKKEMRAFHSVVGADRDNETLLATAREVAVHRVVVKRPKKASPWMGVEPSFSLAGKAVRFDIYAKKAFAKC